MMAKPSSTADSICDAHASGVLPLRVVTTCEPEEKRRASAVGDGELTDPAAIDVPCSPSSDDERAVGIPMTSDLAPLERPGRHVIELALQTLRGHEDWLLQHESITTLRRCIVHHPSLLHDVDLAATVPALVLGSDNLRSALSKNAMLALAECFEYLDAPRCLPFLRPPSETTTVVPLVDVVLRRATCEKKFLRDAAMEAVDNLIMFLASPELVVSVTPYASSKSAKIVAIASKLMAQSCARLQALGTWDVDVFASARMHAVYQVLAKFRDGKDSAARNESAACLKLLGKALGKERFQSTLQAALLLPAGPQHAHTTQSIMNEVFPPVASPPLLQNRRGSLRDRMLLHQQQVQSTSFYY